MRKGACLKWASPVDNGANHYPGKTFCVRKDIIEKCRRVNNHPLKKILG
jgi:hypothetical protein